jgi:hypothetical protein
VTSRSISKVFTFLLTLFPRLTKLFFLYISLVLFFLLLRIGFGPNLTPFWGYLNLVLHALVCFIGSFKPSRRSRTSFLLTPWSNCLKPNARINMVLILLVARLVFALYSKWLFRSTKGLCLPQEVYGRWLVFPLGGIFMCLMCAPFFSLMGQFFNHLSLSMSNFRESQWVQSH